MTHTYRVEECKLDPIPTEMEGVNLTHTYRVVESTPKPIPTEWESHKRVKKINVKFIDLQ